MRSDRFLPHASASTALGRMGCWLIQLTLLMFLVVGLSACSPSGPASPAADTVVVYKDPSCGCCSKWIEHLKQSGFKVEPHDESAMNPLKTRLGVPLELASCHTAVVGGYLIEGHVPAQDIRRLLTEKPAIKGLVVPGMPIGSPGMEQGERKDPYEVLAFGGQGDPKVFAKHGGDEDTAVHE